MGPGAVAQACDPSTLGGRGGRITRSRDRDHGETPSLLKRNTKISWAWWCACGPSYSGDWGRRIAWTQEAEVAVSRDCAIALQPGQQSETPSQKKKESLYEALRSNVEWTNCSLCSIIGFFLHFGYVRVLNFCCIKHHSNHTPYSLWNN